MSDIFKNLNFGKFVPFEPKDGIIKIEPINWEYEFGIYNCHVQHFWDKREAECNFWQRDHPTLGKCFVNVSPELTMQAYRRESEEFFMNIVKDFGPIKIVRYEA